MRGYALDVRHHRATVSLMTLSSSVVPSTLEFDKLVIKLNNSNPLCPSIDQPFQPTCVHFWCKLLLCLVFSLLLNSTSLPTLSLQPFYPVFLSTLLTQSTSLLYLPILSPSTKRPPKNATKTQPFSTSTQFSKHRVNPTK